MRTPMLLVSNEHHTTIFFSQKRLPALPSSSLTTDGMPLGGALLSGLVPRAGEKQPQEAGF